MFNKHLLVVLLSIFICKFNVFFVNGLLFKSTYRKSFQNRATRNNENSIDTETKLLNRLLSSVIEKVSKYLNNNSTFDSKNQKPLKLSFQSNHRSKVLRFFFIGQ